MFSRKQTRGNPFQLTAFLLLNGAQEEEIHQLYEMKQPRYDAYDASRTCRKFRHMQLSKWKSYDLKDDKLVYLPG